MQKLQLEFFLSLIGATKKNSDQRTTLRPVQQGAVYKTV